MQVQEDENNLIPFAKCSRVVSRSPPPSLPSQSLRPTPKCYGDIFWENLTQRSCPIWMEEQYIPPMLRTTGCSQPGLYPPGGLPPPEMLCRRKRRGHQLNGMQHGPGGIPARVRAVAYHLEDLRRRQRAINELKKAQWGISEAAPERLEVHEEDCEFLRPSDYPDLEKEEATYPQEEDHLIAPAALVSLESPGPGEGLCLQAAELSGPQHCHSQEESCLQSLRDGVEVGGVRPFQDTYCFKSPKPVPSHQNYPTVSIQEASFPLPCQPLVPFSRPGIHSPHGPPSQSPLSQGLPSPAFH